MPRPAVSAVLALLLASTACRRTPASPPAGEFLVLAGDSTFWVHTGAEGIRARGSPLQLARYRGRFYEVYITDDDRSYTDALIVGQQMYRRDLLSDDSALVFEDTTISHIARWYGHEHPNDHPLDTDDEPDADPHVSAQSELNTVAQHGQYLSPDAERPTRDYVVALAYYEPEQTIPPRLTSLQREKSAPRLRPIITRRHAIASLPKFSASDADFSSDGIIMTSTRLFS